MNTPEIPPSEDQEIPEILSVKLVDGSYYSGECLPLITENKIPILRLKIDTICVFIPLSQCIWWAIGPKTMLEIEQDQKLKMKEQAKIVLAELQQKVQKSEPQQSRGVAASASPRAQQIEKRLVKGQGATSAFPRSTVQVSGQPLQPGDEAGEKSEQPIERLPDEENVEE